MKKILNVILFSTLFFGSLNLISCSKEGGNCSSVKCSSSTQSGNRCQRITTNCNGRCWQHQ